MLRLPPLLAVLALLASGVGSEPAVAAERTITTTYGATILGLPIGQASFDTVIDGDAFRIDGTLSSAGIGSLVSDTSGTSSVSGRVGEERFWAERYRLDYSNGDKRWTSDVRFRNGQAVSATIGPKRDNKEKSFVPIEKSQLTSVVDPLAGLMIKADGAGDVCNRTLPFYDGWSRLDMRLSPAGTRPFAMEGYSGEAAVCEVRIRPVGGYDRDSKGLKYLQDRTIEMWFAPIAAEDVYVPVHVAIPTTIGSLTLAAKSVSTR